MTVDAAAAPAAADGYSSMADDKSSTAAAAPAAEDMESGRSNPSSQSADHQAGGSEPVTISNKQYRRFYLVMAVTSMYLCMLLTNWGNRESVDNKGLADETTSKEKHVGEGSDAVDGVGSVRLELDRASRAQRQRLLVRLAAEGKTEETTFSWQVESTCVSCSACISRFVCTCSCV